MLVKICYNFPTDIVGQEMSKYTPNQMIEISWYQEQ